MNGKYVLLKVIGLAFVALSVINCSKSGGGGGSSSPAPVCAANYTQTAAGCLPTCGSGLVMYNNQCIPVTQVTGTSPIGGGMTCTGQTVYMGGQCVPIQNTGGGGTTYPPYGGQTNICSGRCGAGAVETYSGCMPQYTCGPCYGYNNGWCHMGVYAHQYYGY